MISRCSVNNIIRKVLLSVTIVSCASLNYMSDTVAYNLHGHKLVAMSISYKFVNSPYQTQWKQALASWNSSGFSFYYMDNALNSLGAKNIGASNLYGQAYFDNINVWGELTKFTAYLNTNASDLANKTNYARSTAAHEIGHAIGLDHVVSSASLMSHSRDRSKIYIPQSDEKNGVMVIYS